MSDTPPPVSDQVNDQIRDAVRQASFLMKEAERPFVRAAAPMIVHAFGLAAYNLVVSAVARALLEGKRDEAEPMLKLAEPRLVIVDVADELRRLLTVLQAAFRALGDTQSCFQSLRLNFLLSF